MVIQDILAFLKKEMTQMREEISEEIAAMKLIFADEEEGSAYPKFEERRGKDAKFEEFNHPRSDSTIDQSNAFESSGKTFVNNDDIDDDTNVNDDIGQEYHQYHDDNDVCDTDEILDNRHDTIEGDNPYCNVTNTLSYIDKKENKSDKDRPCWMAKLQGSRHKHSPHQQHSSLLPIKIYDPGK